MPNRVMVVYVVVGVGTLLCLGRWVGKKRKRRNFSSSVLNKLSALAASAVRAQVSCGETVCEWKDLGAKGPVGFITTADYFIVLQRCVLSRR
jgi:hypothetical protein